MMNERVFQQRLNDEMSEIYLTQAEKTTILRRLYQQPVYRKLRLSTAVTVIIVISLLVIGALAWILAPTIADWFEQRKDPRISSAFLKNVPIASPLAERRIGDVAVTVWEAMADEKTFATNTQFQYNGNGDVELAAFGGLTHEITSEEGVVYVSAVSYFGAASNEIYKAVQSDERTLSILSEGWQQDNTSDTLFIEITLVSEAEPEPVKTLIEVPVTSLAVFECYSLPEPFVFRETGFVLKSLAVVRTELRVYFSYEISGVQRPLASAVQNLEVRVFDQNGARLHSTLSYENPVPDMLILQVVNIDSNEIVEQVQFRLEENNYLPAVTTGEEIQ